MAAMKPRTGDGPLEVTKEGRGIVMRVPLEGGGRLVVEMTRTRPAICGRPCRAWSAEPHRPWASPGAAFADPALPTPLAELVLTEPGRSRRSDGALAASRRRLASRGADGTHATALRRDGTGTTTRAPAEVVDGAPPGGGPPRAPSPRCRASPRGGWSASVPAPRRTGAPPVRPPSRAVRDARRAAGAERRPTPPTGAPSCAPDRRADAPDDAPGGRRWPPASSWARTASPCGRRAGRRCRGAPRRARRAPRRRDRAVELAARHRAAPATSPTPLGHQVARLVRPHRHRARGRRRGLSVDGPRRAWLAEHGFGGCSRSGAARRARPGCSS